MPELKHELLNCLWIPMYSVTKALEEKGNTGIERFMECELTSKTGVQLTLF